jgi:hypothetical protein
MKVIIERGALQAAAGTARDLEYRLRRAHLTNIHEKSKRLAEQLERLAKTSPPMEDDGDPYDPVVERVAAPRCLQCGRRVFNGEDDGICLACMYRRARAEDIDNG